MLPSFCAPLAELSLWSRLATPSRLGRIARRIAIHALLLVCLTAVGVVGALAQAPPLFTAPASIEALVPRMGATPDDPIEVLRSRSTGIGKAARRAISARQSAAREPISQAAAESPDVLLNLFGDTSLPFFIDRVEPTADGVGHSLLGRAGSEGEGRAIVTIYGAAVAGSLRLLNGEHYDWFVPTSGAGEIRQVRFQGYTHPGTDAVPVKGESTGAEDSRAGGTGAEGLSNPPVRSAGNPATVDVLIAYTARARQARGDATGMLAHIHQVIAETNTAFANSGAEIQFRLAHAVEVVYDDSLAGTSLSSALASLRSTSDSFLNEIHALRDEYQADLVSLWLSPPLPGSGSFTVGQAYMLTSNPGGFAGFAYSVVHQSYAGGASSTFAHEAGHNFGLNHDADNGGSGGGFRPYARGYQQETLTPKFFTIMAYANGCSGCSSLIQYSNPRVSHQSVPTGIADSVDAVRALNEVGPFAAAWRATTAAPCTYTLSPPGINVAAPGGSFSVNVSTSSGCAWTPSAGPSWLTIPDAAARTGSGSFSVTVAANSSTASRSGSVSAGGESVNVSQAGAVILPTLTVSTSSVSLSAVSGASQGVSSAVTVSSSGTPLPVTVTGTRPAWLTVSPLSFQTPASLTISVSPATLAPGNYTASVTLSSSGSVNPTAIVRVSLTVVGTAPVPFSAKGLSFHADAATLPPTQILQVRAAAGIASIGWSAADAAWLTASASQANGLWTFTVRADPRGLADGAYDATLALHCAPLACSPAAVPVRLTVRSGAAVPSGNRPAIGSGGIVNAASFLPGMASGAWMSLFGTNLAPSARNWSAQDFQGDAMPTTLNGVRVLVDGQPAALPFVSPGQVNFQVPAGLAEGWVQVEIRTAAGADTAWVYASPEAPGFFQFDSSGNLAALHPDGAPAGARGTMANARPASRGVVLALYGTGFGPTSPDVPPGRVFTGAATLNSAGSLSVTIGGVSAAVEFAGLTAAGLNQINVTVPDLPAGTHDVLALVNGVPTQFRGKLRVE